MYRLVILSVLALMASLVSSCMFVSIPLSIPSREYSEVPVQEGSRNEKILILDIDGTITSGSIQESTFGLDNDSTVNQVAGKLEKAAEESNLKAIILRIDSPGGGVTASDVVYRMIADFKKEHEIPIYVSILDVAASGGYYIAMAADEIYAHPTSVTGSIGVIAVIPQLEGLGQKIGVHMEVIKSGENKDIGGIFKDMSDEQRAILQGVIDDMYETFVGVVQTGRPNLTEQAIRTLADGRIYTANDAKESGLIDGIMYLDELVEHVSKKHRLEDPQVIFYRRTVRENYSSVYAQARHSLPQTEDGDQQINVGLVNIPGASALPGRPMFHYLWTH